MSPTIKATILFKTVLCRRRRETLFCPLPVQRSVKQEAKHHAAVISNHFQAVKRINRQKKNNVFHQSSQEFSQKFSDLEGGEVKGRPRARSQSTIPQWTESKKSEQSG